MDPKLGPPKATQNESLFGLDKRHTALPCLQTRHLDFPNSLWLLQSWAISFPSQHQSPSPGALSSDCIFKGCHFPLPFPSFSSRSFLPLTSRRSSSCYLCRSQHYSASASRTASQPRTAARPGTWRLSICATGACAARKRPGLGGLPTCIRPARSSSAAESAIKTMMA